MAWFKVDDKLHSHQKATRAGAEAMGLWVLAGSWCMDHLTDGFIPAVVIRRLVDRSSKPAIRLVACGLWENAEREGEKGYLFHDWDEFQPTAEKVKADRISARERMANIRRGSGAVRANEQRTSEPVRDLFVTPDPTRPEVLSEPLAASGPKRAPERPIPDEWAPSEAHQKSAKERRVDLEREAFRFRNHSLANDRRLRSWDAGFTNWLLKAEEMAPPAKPKYNPRIGEAYR